MQRSPARNPPFHCQPLNEVWERVDPGSTPSGHSGTPHAPELPWVGPTFAPGAQSLLQAMTAFLLWNFSGDTLTIVSSNTHSSDLSWSKREGDLKKKKKNRLLTFERPAWQVLYFLCFFFPFSFHLKLPAAVMNLPEMKVVQRPMQPAALLVLCCDYLDKSWLHSPTALRNCTFALHSVLLQLLTFRCI